MKQSGTSPRQDEHAGRPRPVMGPVLVLGGYGAVGSVTTRALAATYPGRVVSAGRDLDRAAREATTIPGVRAARADATDPAGVAELIEKHRVSAVVLAVEPPSPDVSRLSLERGVHVVDVSATAELLGETERMHDLARSRGASAMLSVGLAPGLTNLLARRVYDDLGGDADHLDITLLIGSGEAHGRDGVRWTVRQLADPRNRRTTTGPRRVDLPDYGPRSAHPFPFSDQHTLRRTLSVPDVTTRLTFDSRVVTSLLFGAQRAGLFRVARGARGRELLTGLLTRVRVGGDGFAVRVDGRRGDRERWQAVTGTNQSRITGLVAARVTEAVLEGRVAAGVRHIEEVADFVDLPEQLADAGVRVWGRKPVDA